MAAPAIGTRTERRMTLDLAAIRAGALAVGDTNPLHHDEAAAAASRFGAVIASGGHMSGLLTGIASALFTTGSYVGTDYACRFRAPVPLGRPILLEWHVAAHEDRRSGTLARLEGRIADLADDATLLSATLAVLCFT